MSRFAVAGAVVLLGFFAQVGNAAKCTQENKQKAMHASFTHEPSLTKNPALDVYGDVDWGNLENLRAHGKNGLYHALQVSWGARLRGGYFGSQVLGDGKDLALFSVWDDGDRGESNWQPALPIIGGDVHDCADFDGEANPGQACCKRNCNDCSGDTTTGTQCKVFIPSLESTHLRLRIRRVATDKTAEYAGKQWTGDVWEVTVKNLENGHHWLVGRQLLTGTSTGITSVQTFYEHIGCTPCESFDAKSRRAGPWVHETDKGTDTALVVAESKYDREDPPYTCKLHSIQREADGVITFQSGPGAPEAKDKGTWDKVLYDCGDEGCAPEDPEPKACSECQGRMACAGAGGFCCNPKAGLGDSCIKGRQGRGRFYCHGKKYPDHGKTCARTYKTCSECQGRMECAGAGGFCCNPKAGLGDSCIKGRQGSGRFYCHGKKYPDHGKTCTRTYD